MSNSNGVVAAAGPKAYIEARCKAEAKLQATASISDSHSTRTRFTIDGKPYLPLLQASSDDYLSMKQIVIEILDDLFVEEHGPGDYSTIIDQLDIVPIIGGNTNQLFCISGIPNTNSCTTTKVPNSKILLRIFGGEGMIDRDIETSTYSSLAQVNVALPYYGRFGNGRLEQWCDTMSVLRDEDMSKPEISKAIAKQIATLHKKFEIPFHLQDYHDVNSKPTVWTQLEEWYNTAAKCHNNRSFQSRHDQKRADSLQILELEKELQWLRTRVIPVQQSSNSNSFQIGFCHNDILASNILCSKNNNNTNDAEKESSSENINLQLLDFEYGGINYFSYDIANHFNEFAGGTDVGQNATPDYTKFPSNDLQYAFIKEYLTTIKQLENGDKEDVVVHPTEEQIAQLQHEIQGFVLGNHLVWGLWAINQAATEGCEGDFDYLQYAKCRLTRYYECKQEYLQNCE